MSWLADYVEYTRHQESPEIFHIWSGITVLGATIARRAWLNRRSKGITRFRIYPGQLMVVLVGASAAVRKTSALDPPRALLKHTNKNIISGKSSVEAFLDQLDPASGGQPSSILLSGELTNFIAKVNYLEPMIDALNELADAKDEFPFSTRGGGKIIIPEPCLTLLAASTPENLGERMPLSAHGAGFMSRIIFVYAKTTERFEPLTDVEDTDVTKEEFIHYQTIEANLKSELVKIKNLIAGPFSYEPLAKKWFEDFYLQWKQSSFGQGEGYPARRPDHLLRIGMIFAASEMKMQLSDRHLISADRILTLAERDFDKAFAFIGTTYAKDRQRIVDYIASKAGTATTKELFTAMYPYFPDADTFRRTLKLLREAGVVQSKIISANPPIEVWSLAGIEFKLGEK